MSDNFKLYRYLDCEELELIKNELFNFLKTINKFKNVRGFTYLIDHNELLQNVKCLKNYFEKNNLDCNYTAFIIFSTYNQINIYRDKGLEKCRIIWPVLNCENSYTNFYLVDETKKETRQGNAAYSQKTYDIYLPEYAKFIDRYELVRPVAANLTEPHSIEVHHHLNGRFNGSGDYEQLYKSRISLYTKFKNDPVHLLR